MVSKWINPGRSIRRQRQQEGKSGFCQKEFAMIQVTFAFLVILFLIAMIIGLIVGVALARPTIR
jgi:hypothetical protein